MAAMLQVCVFWAKVEFELDWPLKEFVIQLTKPFISFGGHLHQYFKLFFYLLPEVLHSLGPCTLAESQWVKDEQRDVRKGRPQISAYSGWTSGMKRILLKHPVPIHPFERLRGIRSCIDPSLKLYFVIFRVRNTGCRFISHQLQDVGSRPGMLSFAPL